MDMVESEGPHPPHTHYLLAFGLLCFALLCLAMASSAHHITCRVTSLHFRGCRMSNFECRMSNVEEEVRSSKTRHDKTRHGNSGFLFFVFVFFGTG